MHISVNKTMYFIRASVCLQVITLVIVCLGLLLQRQPGIRIERLAGRINVQVHQVVYVAEEKAPDSFRMTAGCVTQVMRPGQTNNTFVFESVAYMGGIVFRVIEGPHPRAGLLLLPIHFKSGPHAYRISNLHIAVMSLNWVKDEALTRR